MKAISFPEQNQVIAKDQPQYNPLPAYADNGPEGIIISKHRLSFRERVRVLFHGTIWLSVMTFGDPFSPIILATRKREVFAINVRNWRYWFAVERLLLYAAIAFFAIGTALATYTVWINWHHVLSTPHKIWSLVPIVAFYTVAILLYHLHRTR